MKKRAPKRKVHREPSIPSSSHFKRDGTPKRPYRTKHEAAEAAQLAWTLQRAELDTYRCDHCHQWHIGRRFREE